MGGKTPDLLKLGIAFAGLLSYIDIDQEISKLNHCYWGIFANNNINIDQKNLNDINADGGKTPDLLKLGIAFAGSVSLQFPICLHQILGPWNIELQE